MYVVMYLVFSVAKLFKVCSIFFLYFVSISCYRNTDIFQIVLKLLSKMLILIGFVKQYDLVILF